MAKIYVKINGIEKCMGIGRKKELEKLKKEMLSDKQKIKQFRIEEIRVE